MCHTRVRTCANPSNQGGLHKVLSLQPKRILAQLNGYYGHILGVLLVLIAMLKSALILQPGCLALVPFCEEEVLEVVQCLPSEILKTPSFTSQIYEEVEGAWLLTSTAVWYNDELFLLTADGLVRVEA